MYSTPRSSVMSRQYSQALGSKLYRCFIYEQITNYANSHSLTILSYQVNGKVESLEMMVNELKQELHEEKFEHNKTMDRLREASYETKDSPPESHIATETGKITSKDSLIFSILIFKFCGCRI